MGHEGSMRILLVDDEEIVHQTLGPYLRDSGHFFGIPATWWIMPMKELPL